MELAAGLTTNQKFDQIMATLSILVKGQENFNKLVAKVDNIETSVTTHTSDIESLKREVRSLKDAANARDQDSRGLSIRLFNFPIIDEDETSLTSKIYERVIKPILLAAKDDGEISTVPSAYNCLECAFRIGRPTFHPDGKPKAPPPVLIRFLTKRMRQAVMSYKKENTPAPSEAEKALGVRRFIIVEDLSPSTYRKLREISSDERVNRAWTTGGQIRFVFKGEDRAVRLVKSVFDSVEYILQHSRVKS